MTNITAIGLIELFSGNDIPDPAPIELNPALAEQLEPHARKIEYLQSKALLRIAEEAAKIHETLRYYRNEGGYTGYMKSRLGISSSSSYRLLDVNRRFGNGESFPSLGKLPASAVYALASSSTPKEALDEVVARIDTCAMVAEVIAKAKGDDRVGDTFQADVAAAIGGARRKAKQVQASEPSETDQTDVNPLVANGVESSEASAERMKAAHAAADNGDSAHNAHGGDIGVAGHDANGDHDRLAAQATYEGGAPIRAQVLADYFATTSGTSILNNITYAANRIDLVREFLDALGIDAMLEAASPEFKKQLSARVPTKPSAWLVEKDAGTIAQTIADTVGMTKADAVRTHLLNLAVPKRQIGKSAEKKFPKLEAVPTRDASGNTIHALEQRGNRSRPH